MKKLLIPAAKVILDELPNIGQLPAIIYPINQEIVFDYLLNQYKDICSQINIICYEQADKVHSRLSSYDFHKINIIDLLELKDLGNTIYYGLGKQNDRIIINFADTIVDDKRIIQTDGDCFFYSEDYKSSKWTYFKEENGVITKIYDKENIKSNNINTTKEKLFVGVFQIEKSSDFKNCLKQAFKEDSKIDSFYRALQIYSRLHPMKSIKTDSWFDIGHLNKYYSSKLEVQSREFNHITIDKNRGILTKTSDDKKKFIGEIGWYLKLPLDLEYSRPRIFDYSLSYSKPYVSMEYYTYHTIHELFLYGELEYQQWIDIFSRIKFICDDYKRYKVKDSNIKKSLEEIYLNKTIERLNKLRENDKFLVFFNKSITINNKKYKSLNEICELLKIYIPQMLYNVDEFNIIHGDLCFSNIMIDSNLNFIKVIDPRGKFGEYDIYGDCRYELAKLLHSLDGCYDYIIKDLFKCKVDINNANIEYKILDSNRDFDIYKLFLEVFKDDIGERLKEIEFIEALLFISMIPLHNENINHQYAMLGTGLQILDRVIDIKERDK